MPYSSAGCQTCKARRVKCDETRPICLRCLKSKRVCVSAEIAKQASFSIHIENSFASGENKRPRGPRPSLSLVRPHADLQVIALAFYMQHYSQALEDVPCIARGLTECVTDWRLSGRANTTVDLALSCLALATFSRVKQHPAAAKAASSEYHHLLRVARNDIAEVGNLTIDQAKIDACLLAASLMGRYEAVIFQCNAPVVNSLLTAWQSWSHQDGAMAILKMWKDYEGPKTASFIVTHTRRSLIKSCLLRRIRLPKWIWRGEDFGETMSEVEYDRIMVRIVNLHHECVQLLKGESFQCESSKIQQVKKLSAGLQMLDQALDTWMGQISGDCFPTQHTLPESQGYPKRNFFSPEVYVFPATGYAGAWSHLFATRMLIHNTRQRLLEVFGPKSECPLGFEQERLKSITKLRNLSTELALAVPFCLERVKIGKAGWVTFPEKQEFRMCLAGQIAWPLTIACSLNNIDSKLLKWFKSELAAIGRIIGDGALEAAETEEWTRL